MSAGAGAGAGAGGSSMIQEYEKVHAEYQSKRQHHMDLVRKVEKLHGDVSEHEVVIRALKAVEPTRRAFSLVGGVLLERTAAEVLPGLETNLHGIKQVVKSLSGRIEAMTPEMDRLQATLTEKANELRALGEARRAAAAKVK